MQLYCGHMLKHWVSSLICPTICFFHITPAHVGDSAESLATCQVFPKLLETSGKELIEMNNNLRVNKRKRKNPGGRLLLYALAVIWRCRLKFKRWKCSRRRQGGARGNNVLMLRLKHAKLMASLFSLGTGELILWVDWRGEAEERGYNVKAVISSQIS